MEKRFRILRIIGTIWKIAAWIALGVGILSALGSLIASIAGSGVVGQVVKENVPQLANVSWASWVFGAVVGVIGFVNFLLIALLYFLSFYAIGDFIYLGISIEENTRTTAQAIAALQYSPAAPAPAPPRYVPPPAQPQPTPPETPYPTPPGIPQP